MNPEEFQTKLQEINNDIKKIMEHHELINEFDPMNDIMNPAFNELSQLLLDYIINVNEKVTTVVMASFFEDQFPEMIKLDPWVFADPDANSSDQIVLAGILRPSYERILILNEQYQKTISLYRYINILTNIKEEINSLEGKSIDLIQEALQKLFLQPIEIDEDY
ncbi:hypothetical protein M9Y10_038566 [Tritrichomonas musculus]|uniref:Uncharacterized protein n=1 Tax=Tritrichomonas musculus TaxID=1915356 RepID=A0ABR2K9C6_9EUKA